MRGKGKPAVATRDYEHQCPVHLAEQAFVVPGINNMIMPNVLLAELFAQHLMQAELKDRLRSHERTSEPT